MNKYIQIFQAFWWGNKFVYCESNDLLYPTEIKLIEPLEYWEVGQELGGN